MSKERVVSVRAEEYLPHIGQKHMFLAGDLKDPNPHRFVRESRIEVILCFYEAGDNGVRHWHPEVTEYEVVVEGEIGYFEVATGQTEWYRAGDMVVTPAGVCVGRLVRERTRTMAIKVPSNRVRVECTGCDRPCQERLAEYHGEVIG